MSVIELGNLVIVTHGEKQTSGVIKAIAPFSVRIEYQTFDDPSKVRNDWFIRSNGKRHGDNGEPPVKWEPWGKNEKS